ncbi:NACHT domain-containing protein [Actinoplanes sp. CA-142083]|uniref:NACHT domain-containing protein n=1 Tax=Actinoplanes sp. CA-142083 TaxID=3239903 RepID=UPI003D91036F
MAVPVEKALGAAVGPIVRRLWQDMVKVPSGAGLAGEPMRLDPRVPFSQPRKELGDAEISRLAAKLAKRLGELRRVEFPSATDGDMTAAADAAGKALARAAPIDIALMFELDLDPVRLVDRVAAVPFTAARRDRMGEVEGRIYEVVLHQAAVHIVDFFTSRPEFLLRAQVEQLRRAGRQEDLLHAIAAAQVAPTADYVRFEREYREAMARSMNRIRTYGLRPERFRGELRKEHALDTAYIPLRMSPADRTTDPDTPVAVGGRPAGEVLSGCPRLILTGSAGSGKTTALQWLALTAADALEHPAGLQPGLVPFFLPMREFSKDARFPRPEEFLDAVAPLLAGDKPPGWVHDCLRTGRAVVLVDGIDEVPRARRGEALEWVRQLVEQWDRARYVITSRPAALEEAWQELDGFASYEIQPLSPAEAATLIRRWQETVGLDDWEAESLDDFVGQLPYVSRLAMLLRNPAMCVLAARVATERHRLFAGVLGLCEESIQLLVETRDVERGLGSIERVFVNYRQRVHILGHLAWWMTRNNLYSVRLDELTNKVRDIAAMFDAGPIDVGLSSEQVQAERVQGIVQYLLVRSGLITLTAPDEVSFTNDVLRHYLSARSALDSNDEPLLMKYAEEGAWNEVVVFAIALQLERGEGSSLAEALIERAGSHPRVARDLYQLVCAGIAEAATQQDAHRILRLMLPVQGVEQAGDLAVCGPALLPLLAEQDASDENAAAGIVRTATLIGGDAALDVIERFRDDSRPAVVTELVRGWNRFDPEPYARQILAGASVGNLTVSIDDNAYLGPLSHLRRLRQLRCTGSFDDVAALSTVLGRLGELTFERCPGLHDLSALRAAGLHRLAVRDCPVDLSTIDPSAAAELSLSYSVSTPELDTLDPAVALTDLVVRPTAARLDLTALKPHQRLRRLSAPGWPSSAEFAVLAGLPDLRELHLTAAVIDDFGQLEGLAALEELHISFYTAPADATPLERLPALSRLRLEHLGFGPLPFRSPSISGDVEISQPGPARPD